MNTLLRCAGAAGGIRSYWLPHRCPPTSVLIAWWYCPLKSNGNGLWYSSISFLYEWTVVFSWTSLSRHLRPFRRTQLGFASISDIASVIIKNPIRVSNTGIPRKDFRNLANSDIALGGGIWIGLAWHRFKTGWEVSYRRGTKKHLF